LRVLLALRAMEDRLWVWMKPNSSPCPKPNRRGLLDLDFKAYIQRVVIDSAKTLGPAPRRKATIGFRVSNGPHVVHFRKHGRWFKWWVFCDGWSEARRSGRSEDCQASVQAAVDAVVDLYVGTPAPPATEDTKSTSPPADPVKAP
jgi:hypothetical protein